MIILALPDAVLDALLARNLTGEDFRIALEVALAQDGYPDPMLNSETCPDLTGSRPLLTVQPGREAAPANGNNYDTSPRREAAGAADFFHKR